MVEVFNLFNVTNILGVNVKNYSGYANVLVRDSSDPAEPGYLRSSSFGQAGDDRGRRVRIGRPARLPVRGARDVSDDEHRTLTRELTLPAATALVVGQVIAVGIFLTPGHDDPRRWRRRSGCCSLWAVMGGDGDLRRALLRRARGPLSAGGRRLRLPARGLRAACRVPVRLEVPADHGPGDHRGARDRIRAATSPTSCRSDRARSAARRDRARSSRSRSSTSRASSSGTRLLTALPFLKLALIGGVDRSARWRAPPGDWSHFVPFASRAAARAAARPGCRRGARRRVLLVRRLVGSHQDRGRSPRSGADAAARAADRARRSSRSSTSRRRWRSFTSIPIERIGDGRGVRRAGRRGDPDRAGRAAPRWRRLSSSACWAAWRRC